VTSGCEEIDGGSWIFHADGMAETMESRFCFARSCQPNVDILTELVLLLADAGLGCVPGCVQVK
jgi:hypothetical protein